MPDSTDLFPRNSGMDSFLDIGWRIGLVFLGIGGLVLFIQRRTGTVLEDKEWNHQSMSDEGMEQFNRPSMAPSLDNFE
ncbi:MAG: hypothetical protein CMA18_006910 [Methanobacteriota archaeon]|nr:MAG: hypothetical protein CBC63_05160 [Euryarchaeota archaeon TMED103]RAH09406.1 MAG: hypothetical protein CMA18_006910 [Euryarchaeota archaeon]